MDTEIIERLDVVKAIQSAQIQHGIPVPQPHVRRGKPRSKMLWLDQLQLPKLREGKEHPRKDLSKLSIERLNEHYILYSGFERDKLTNCTQTIAHASKRNKAKYLSRYLKEVHEGEEIWVTRCWRIG